MTRVRKTIRIMVLLLLLMLSVSAFGARAWESADRLPRECVEQRIEGEDAVAAVAEGYLYVSVRQRSVVKLFTILGQPVVQQTLAPGTYRFRLPSRGIYLLKVGSSTRRISI